MGALAKSMAVTLCAIVLLTAMGVDMPWYAWVALGAGIRFAMPDDRE